MTELMQLYLQNREEAEKKIKNMDAALLLAELDDTIQIDLMALSTIKWMELPRRKAGVYHTILKELADRLHALEK